VTRKFSHLEAVNALILLNFINDLDEGRINRLGASIVFLFFGLLVALLLVGTNVISYTLSIQHATDYFDKQKYNDAYNEVYGIDIKAEDIVIYDKIMTVMFVNKQLNSYNNYYSLGEYPEALDSLLKGLKRYDKYIEFATIIGIKTDLDYVRGQILAELKNVFNLSEKDAVKIISMDNMEDYSSEVYNVVLEKMNN
jgi:tetratricopeptide (TPR) repeat protein